MLTKETKKALRTVLDDAIELKGLQEIGSDVAIYGGIELIDYFGDKVVPDKYDEVLNQLCWAVINKDYDGAGRIIADVAAELIDVPMIDDASEQVIFRQGVAFIILAIKNYIEKKKLSEEG